MKKSLFLWQIIGITFTAVLGTILHFIYEWTKAIWLTPISAINESTWEHMKLLFFPSLIFAIAQCLHFKDTLKNFWCVKLIGIIFGVLLIPTLFYTYNGTLGKSPDWFNILIFFIADISSYTLEGYLFKFKKEFPKLCKLSFFTLILITATFIYFTYYPPILPIFKDPLSNLYGLIL